MTKLLFVAALAASALVAAAGADAAVNCSADIGTLLLKNFTFETQGKTYKRNLLYSPFDARNLTTDLTTKPGTDCGKAYAYVLNAPDDYPRCFPTLVSKDDSGAVCVSRVKRATKVIENTITLRVACDKTASRLALKPGVTKISEITTVVSGKAVFRSTVDLVSSAVCGADVPTTTTTAAPAGPTTAPSKTTSSPNGAASMKSTVAAALAIGVAGLAALAL